MDLFDRAYLRLDDGAPEPPERELAARVAPHEAVALRGCVLTPEGPLPDGYVVVDGGTIAQVTAARPAGVRVHETDGVILPGLIDLHGHPEFNVFAAWEPPQRFANRYRWRSSPLYQSLILEHYRHPRNQGELEGADARVHLHNPSPGDARDTIAALGEVARLDVHELSGLQISTSEAVTNAMLYGVAPVDVRVWAATGRMVVAVRDAGPGPTDPFAGLIPVHELQVGGRGLWLMHQLCTFVSLQREPDGFTVRLVAGEHRGAGSASA